MLIHTFIRVQGLPAFGSAGGDQGLPARLRRINLWRRRRRPGIQGVEWNTNRRVQGFEDPRGRVKCLKTPLT